MKKVSAIRLALLSSLPVSIHLCMSLLYVECRLWINDALSLAAFDPFHFDANDMTRWYFIILVFITIFISVIIAARYTHDKNVRAAIIGVLSVILFYMSELFCQGMMLK